MTYDRATVDAAVEVCSQIADNDHYDTIARAAAKALRERIARLATMPVPKAKAA